MMVSEDAVVIIFHPTAAKVYSAPAGAGSGAPGGFMRVILTIVLFFASASWGVMAQNAGSPPASQGSAALDYEFFKARVQPIFLAKRPGQARCVACHASGTPMRLQPLAPGSSTWSEEESRKNFDAVRRMVVPGSAKSMLLVHPLA